MEQRARAAGADRIRLDTRNDLVEARALYARHGYVEIPPYSADQYAELWFEKLLPELTTVASRAITEEEVESSRLNLTPSARRTEEARPC